MNRKLISLAVAAAMVAPLAVAAETTLYGRIDTAVVNVDVDDEGGTSTGDAWDVDTGTTRIGVKGSEDLGNGLTAIFQAEWQFTSSEDSNSSGSLGGGFDNRLGYAGLRGGFGTVTLGRQWTPYYKAVDQTDIFNTPGNAGTGPNLVSANKAYLGPTRRGNQLTYSSPDFNGLSVHTSLFMDREEGFGDSDGIDSWNPAVIYKNGPIKAGLSYIGYDNDIDGSDTWGVSGSYNFGMFKLIAQYEDADESNVTDSGEGDAWAIAAEGYFGNNTVRGLYGQRDPDDGDDMDVYALSFQHNFSKRTRAYVEYIVNDNDEDVDRTEFSLGFRHDF